MFWEREEVFGSGMGSVVQPSNRVISRMEVSTVQTKASVIPLVTKVQLPMKSVKADLCPKSYKTSLSIGERHQTCDQLPVSEPLALCTGQF